MPDTYTSFRDGVINRIAVPSGAAILSYAEYMSQPEGALPADEQSFVDDRFTRYLLEWLGYSDTDYQYNPRGDAQNVPDFQVRTDSGSRAFVVEDKRTSVRWDPVEHGAQLRRYTAGTQGYAIWTNGRRILGLRFDPQGAFSTLVDIDIIAEFGMQTPLFRQEEPLRYLHQLYNRGRYNDLDSRIDAIIRIPPDQWAANALPVIDRASLEHFISDSRTALDMLATAAYSRLSSSLAVLDEANVHRADAQARYRALTTEMLDRMGAGLRARLPEDAFAQLAGLEYQLASLTPTRLDAFRPANLAMGQARIWDDWRDSVNSMAIDLRARSMAIARSMQIAEAYQIWAEKYQIIEEATENEAARDQARRTAYSEQVAYVFFVRLLLARVLEDKGVIPRLISDGGLGDWQQFLANHMYLAAAALGSGAAPASRELFPSLLTQMLYRNVSRYYHQFYDQPVFDWFEVDDYLLVITLEHLNKYNFRDIDSDLIGYTYESFIDRRARNRKGHFLTKPDIVGYILDRAEYRGAQVIGRKLLDPACGSGSFLVEAALRLRAALAARLGVGDGADGRAGAAVEGAARLRLAREFVERAQTQLFGMEINPFSCYLAELNLFLQVLDDVIYLWQHGEQVDVEGFSIANSNSLELPRTVLRTPDGHQHMELSADEVELEDRLMGEGAGVKRLAGSFWYVVGNPPYVNRGMILSAPSYASIPFYGAILQGDENTYLLFLRLAMYYCAPGGKVALIIPLNLFGDKSSQRAREILGTDWTVLHLTRFYKRTVLFEGVLQGVCVVVLCNTLPPAPGAPGYDYTLTISGGDDVGQAREPTNTISLHRSAVLNAHLTDRRTTWYKGWVVTTPALAYTIWGHIRRVVATDVGNITLNKLDGGQGDVNATYVDPLTTNAPLPGAVPLTKGTHVTDFGDWQPEKYINWRNTPPTGRRNTETARSKVERIATLDHTEAVIFLKEVSGLEMRRPVRGTVVERDAGRPVAAGHTLLSIRSMTTSYNDLAYAIYALLVSSTSNYIFGLFSTNAHVSIAEMLRTPTPSWTEEIERELSGLARAAIDVGRRLDARTREFGGRAEVDVSEVLRASRLPTMHLGDAILGGLLTAPVHANYRVGRLAASGEIAPADDGNDDGADTAYGELVRAILARTNSPYGQAAHIVLPDPSVAIQLKARVDAANAELARLRSELGGATRALDQAVYRWYRITNPDWQAVIERGMPWSE